MLVSLRLRCKGYKLARDKASRLKPLTTQQRDLATRIFALASFLNEDRVMTFDSDSFPIALDKCASHCMTNDEADFVEDTVTVEVNVTGVGQTQATKMGTILWTIEDDNGTANDEFIPNSYLVPNLPIRLMSPQHWSQVNKARNAHSDTDADRITLECDDYAKTVPLNDSNIAIMPSAPGFRNARGIISFHLMKNKTHKSSSWRMWMMNSSK
jgi:hypothetical protein